MDGVDSGRVGAPPLPAWVVSTEAMDIRWDVTMTYDPERHHRRSIRLPEYDYSQGGTYFVTICVQGRAYALGAVTAGDMRLSEQGEVVAHCWAAITDHFPTVVLDTSVIMPNHLHGIVFLSDSQISTERPTLAKIIGDFKSASARRLTAVLTVIGPG